MLAKFKMSSLTAFGITVIELSGTDSNFLISCLEKELTVSTFIAFPTVREITHLWYVR